MAGIIHFYPSGFDVCPLCGDVYGIVSEEHYARSVGDVCVIVSEEHAAQCPHCDDATQPDPDCACWDQTDSVWGFVGYDYAMDSLTSGEY